MSRLSGKTAIVTGASAGLGLAIARAFAAEGCSLLMTGRNSDRLLASAEAIRREHQVNIVTVSGDVAEPSHVEKVFDEVNAKFSQLDLLVNNAGAFDGGPIDELDLAAWDRVINTNLRGPFLFSQQAMRVMKKNGGGRIINIGSISAQRVRPASAAYSTSKHGLWGLTQVTALEGREHGVTCCCIHPGNIEVERRATNNPEDQEPMMSPAEVAEVVLLSATLPPHVQMLESIVLPHRQDYVGRG